MATHCFLGRLDNIITHALGMLRLSECGLIEAQVAIFVLVVSSNYYVGMESTCILCV